MAILKLGIVEHPRGDACTFGGSTCRIVAVLRTSWGCAPGILAVFQIVSKKPPANLLLLLGSAALVFFLAEFTLRFRYAEPLRTPSDEILAIQPHLRLDPRIGFTWNADVSADGNIVFEVADAEFKPLSTDPLGFINAPEAIAARAAGGPVDIIGLGDSFVEHAAHSFYTFFAVQGFTYYSMAIHRQAPPQYNIILEDNGLPLDPKWIVYGLFENDFRETEDFYSWKASGLDWFTFHSGTWCGAPLAQTALARFKDEHFSGYGGLVNAIRTRFRGDKMSLSGPSALQVSRVREAVLRAAELAESSGARFLLLLIPSRATVVEGPTAESRAYDSVVEDLPAAGAAIIDLRDTFRAHPDPASLYYTLDGHWNGKGMDLAARAILGVLRADLEK